MALAAGIGSRYGGLKQLEPVGPAGETLLEYSVYDALRAGFSRVVLVVTPEAESAFRDKFDPGMALRVPVSYVRQSLTDLPSDGEVPTERAKPWGTGHAVLAARREIQGPFAVVNADDFYGAEPFAALSRFLNNHRIQISKPTLAMIGFEVGSTLSDAGPVSRAVCKLDGEGRLEEIIEVLEMWKRNSGGFYLDADGEERQIAGDRLVSMNIWGLVPGVLPEFEKRFRDFLQLEGQDPGSEFLVPDVIQGLIRDGKMQVEVLPHGGACYGITYPEDRQRVAKHIAMMTYQGVYPAGLWQ